MIKTSIWILFNPNNWAFDCIPADAIPRPPHPSTPPSPSYSLRSRTTSGHKTKVQLEADKQPTSQTNMATTVRISMSIEKNI